MKKDDSNPSELPVPEHEQNLRGLVSGMEVWFVAAEAVPYVKVGGLGDVAGELPRALSNLGVSIRLCVPLHGSMALPDNGVTCIHFDVRSDGDSEPCTVFEWVDEGLPVQAYDLPRWFRRERVYGYPDDGDRYAAFCLAVASHAAFCVNPPSILHLNDWHAAPIAMLARHAPTTGPGAALRQIRTLLTLHSMEYQGMARPSLAEKFGLGNEVMGKEGALWHGGFNALKSGIAWADAISTVSPTYAREIIQTGNGFGLEGFLAQRVRSLPPSRYVGILNGLGKSWDPSADNRIVKQFSDQGLQDREPNRTALRREMGFPKTDNPMAAYVGRLVPGKGIGLLLEAAPALMEKGLQLAVLGAGDAEYERALTELAASSHGVMSFRCGFDESLARRIYAGADMLLMPSIYEACGLSQQIAMRYGCLPVVRKTGGLADTVREGYNGFVFSMAGSSALYLAVRRAMKRFPNLNAWREMMENAMRTDSSWESSAEAYISLYAELLK